MKGQGIWDLVSSTLEARFLSLGPTDIGGPSVLVQGRPEYYRTLGSMDGLDPLDPSSTHPNFNKPKLSPDMMSFVGGHSCPQLRIPTQGVLESSSQHPWPLLMGLWHPEDLVSPTVL